MSIVFWKDLSPSALDCKVATACIRILKQRLDGQITEADFEKELAYVVLEEECLQDHAYKTTPEKGIEVQKATQALEAEKQALRPNEFLDMGAFHKAHPSLMDYNNKADGVTRTNQRNGSELLRLHAYFKRLGDLIATMKIYEVYKTYPQSMWIGGSMVWRKKNI